MKKFLLLFCLLLSYSFAQLITIDAEKDAFYDNLTGPDDGLIYFPPETGLTEGAFVLPDDADDHSALFWSAWDEEYFYYYVEVTDDIFCVTNTTHWQNDCIEVKYDPDPSKPSSSTIQTTITLYDADVAGEPARPPREPSRTPLCLGPGAPRQRMGGAYRMPPLFHSWLSPRSMFRGASSRLSVA